MITDNHLSYTCREEVLVGQASESLADGSSDQRLEKMVPTPCHVVSYKRTWEYCLAPSSQPLQHRGSRRTEYLAATKHKMTSSSLMPLPPASYTTCPLFELGLNCDISHIAVSASIIDTYTSVMGVTGHHGHGNAGNIWVQGPMTRLKVRTLGAGGLLRVAHARTGIPG